MMHVSHFGKMGDLVYALPVLRALHRLTGTKVTLLTSGLCYQMAPLLEEQPYIEEVELEDTKAHEIVPIIRGAIFPHWEWFTDGHGFNLSPQPDFFKDDAPISWTRCYMQAAGIEHLDFADTQVFPSLLNHHRWMNGIDVELNGKRVEKPKTIVLAPEVESLSELPYQEWQRVIDRVQDAGYTPIIVGTKPHTSFFNCTDLRGCTTVPVLARLIADARGFIGAHSFPWHLARHSETPAVCLQTWREGLRRCLPIDTPYTWLTPEEWEMAVPHVLGLVKPQEVNAHD
jgi:ADP-heptose:LPS heptosyltransferase